MNENIIERVRNELNRIVKGDIGEELSDFTILEILDFSCRTDEDFAIVEDYLKNNPHASRNDIISLLLDIEDKYSENN